jgi:two-component system nitrogen regulation response regulator NtrX
LIFDSISMADSILIVDDERGIRDALVALLEEEGFEAEAAATGEDCLRALERKRFACVLLDVWLPGIDGLDVLRRIKSNEDGAAFASPAVVMISGHGTIETAVRATKLGAFDFIEKPFTTDRVVLTVRNALRQRELERVNSQILEELRAEYVMIGESAPMRALRQQIALVAPTDARVLIYGESGTGKELVARAIHANSRRASAPFVETNCAAIPEELIESELFGHTKGAFTGATQSKRGKFELADGATIFLDEVGDMSLRAQAKVLRVLEEGKFELVGGATAMRVDVRVLAATNKRLEDEIERGAFREDLFYRLNVIPFEVPPLRDRLEDVPLLVEHFNRKFSVAHGKRPKEFSSDALDKLQNYSFPGNVRELKNTVERVVIMHAGDVVKASDLPPLGANAPPATPFRFPSFKEASEAFDREFIRRKLEEAEGNVTRAAELMGIDRSHLYRRMRALGIERGKEQG